MKEYLIQPKVGVSSAQLVKILKHAGVENLLLLPQLESVVIGYDGDVSIIKALPGVFDVVSVDGVESICS